MRRRYLIVLLIAVSVLLVLVGYYGTDASAKRLSYFTSTAYGATLDNQLAVFVDIYNSLPEDGDYMVPRGYQPLTLRVRLHNLSLLQWRKVYLALRFSETVVDYLELREPGILLNIGVVQPASDWESTKVYFIPEFNGDRAAVEKAAKLVSSPIMAQLTTQDKSDLLLIAPEVDFAVVSAVPRVELLLDQWGDLGLRYREGEGMLYVLNTATGRETSYSGSTGFFTSSGELVVLEPNGSVILYGGQASSYRSLVGGVGCLPPLHFDVARERFAVITRGEGHEAILVYDLTSDGIYTFPYEPGDTIFGWTGEGVLLGSETTTGLGLKMLSLDGSMRELNVSGLPAPIGTPVWDPEHRYVAYSAADSRVVVVDVLEQGSQLITDATEPVWTSLGLHVTFQSVGRVIRF